MFRRIIISSTPICNRAGKRYQIDNQDGFKTHWYALIRVGEGGTPSWGDTVARYDKRTGINPGTNTGMRHRWFFPGTSGF
jgi:hypothetical protein